jgi:general L-amino acid transport system substrate-binding protein
MVAKEMHGPMVRNGDPEWAQLVRWTVFALIQAEEYGLTRANVEKAKADSTDPQIRRFLGLTENVGTGFGLPATWAFEVVRQIGNYGEMFERTAGKGGLGLERGPNRLWTNGGLLISWLWQ